MTDRRCAVQRRRRSKETKKGGIAQLARASALQAEGRRFDSDYLHNQFIEKTGKVQASKARSQFKAGQTGEIKDIYKEEFDPGSG